MVGRLGTSGFETGSRVASGEWSSSLRRIGTILLVFASLITSYKISALCCFNVMIVSVLVILN